MTENHELWNEILKAGGFKRVAHAVGRDTSTVHRWARHPLDIDTPDGTGGRGLLDWLEATVDVLASRRTARPTLIRVEHWCTMMFRRAREESQGDPITVDRLREKAATALHETADLITACCGGDVDRARVLSEALEARDVLDRIIAALDHEIIEEEIPSIRRRA